MNLDGISDIRPGQIGDPDLPRIPEVHRRPMHGGEGEVTWIALIASAARNGSVDTTSGPLETPAATVRRW
jgi:hypothetical protein